MGREHTGCRAAQGNGLPRSFIPLKSLMLEADRAERMRPKTREEFKATSALSKLGIKIAGSVADYRGAESLRKQ